MTHKKMPIPAGHVNGLNTGTPGQTVLTALAGGGVRGTDGRPVYLVMTDAEVRGILARLATDPRWSPAVEALLAVSFPMTTASAGERERYRLHLCERMAEAMIAAEKP